MRKYYQDLTAMIAMLIMLCTMWLGLAMYYVAFNQDVPDTTQIEQQLSDARQQYIDWFGVDPVKE